MQPDTSPIPHTLAQWFGLALATFLAALGGWLARRKREPHEIDKLRAETKHIHITAENAQVGVGLETLREIQAVIEKAEQRREEWNRREEELRTQIRFWRNKAEELDGEAIGLREDFDQLETRYKKKDHELKCAMALLLKHEISYSELDQPRES